MKLLGLTLAVAAGVFLAACDAPASSSQGTASSIPSGKDVGPGDNDADAVLAAMVFGDVCAKNGPSFKGSRAALAKLPFAQNSDTGTYYHQAVNLSIKLQKRGAKPICSVVYAGKDLTRASGLILLATATNRTDVVLVDV